MVNSGIENGISKENEPDSEMSKTKGRACSSENSISFKNQGVPYKSIE